MPEPTVNAVHQLRIVGQNHGGQTINVLHFGQTVNIFDDFDALSTFLTQLSEAMMECVLDALLPALSDDWSFRFVDARQVLPTKSDPIVVGPQAASVGAIAASLPSFNAQRISIFTGFGGNRGRGDIFLPPPPEGGVSQSSLTAGQIALLVTFATCVAGKFIGQGRSFTNATLGVLSRTDIKEGKSFDEAFRAAQKLTVNAQVARMGSRTVGKGS